MARYTPAFKARMVERMIGEEGISATALAAEAGLVQQTLSRWLREARRLSPMNKKRESDPTRGPHGFTAEEKLQIVLEAASLSDDALGAFLRERGLHEAQLIEWRDVVMQASTEALDGGKRAKARNAREAKRIKALERELRRKEKALAEVAALLALKKKADQLWGGEDDDTATTSGS